MIRLGGNAGTARNYQLANQRPNQGNNDYRLRVVDADNKSAWSKVIRMDFINPIR